MADAVTTVSVTQKLGEVRRLMSDEGILHVPVVSGRKLVGIISATDMLRLSLSAHGAHEPSIEQVMRTDLVTLEASDTVRDAARHLRAGQFHALPVVDDEQQLVGIVTSTDLVRYLYDQY